MSYLENIAGVTLDFVNPAEKPRVTFADGARAIRDTMYGVAGGFSVTSAVVEYGADTTPGHAMALLLASYGGLAVLAGVVYSGDSVAPSDSEVTNT